MTTRIDAVGARCQGAPSGQVGTRLLSQYIAAQFGGTNLGIYNCRNVRGSSSKSVHSEGRAIDVYFSQRRTLDALFSFLIDNASELGIQAIHDYDNSLRWTGATGWRKGNIGPYPHKYETHIEQNWQGARDTRPIGDRVPRVGPTPVPRPQVMPVWPVSEDDEMLLIQKGKNPDVNRPATAELLKASQQIILRNQAAIGGDVAFVGVRVFDIRTVNAEGWPVMGWFDRDDGTGPTVMLAAPDGEAHTRHLVWT